MKILKNILLGILGGLGFGSMIACAYGPASRQYTYKGVVTSKSDGVPIAGIAITLQNASGDKETETISNTQGQYTVITYCRNQSCDKYQLQFRDTDGPANGGEFTEETRPVSAAKEENPNAASGDKTLLLDVALTRK